MASQDIEDYIREQVREIHQGNCPRCGASGPVDLHTSYWVWSALFFTRWGSSPLICCRKCGRTEQIKASLFSLFLGWWGFPWGILMTPFQIIRNLMGIFGGPSDTKPSENLYMVVHKHITQDLNTPTS
jgi:hypothetical protein